VLNGAKPAVIDSVWNWLSVPSEAMSSALNQPLAHRMGEGSRVSVVTGRNLRLVVRQVLVERRARGHAGLLQFDDHQRQAVDEAHQIRAAGVERARDAELADQQETPGAKTLARKELQPRINSDGHGSAGATETL